MRNWYGVFAVLLLALACKVVLAQIGPRYSVELAAARSAGIGQQQGRLELAGKGLALIRFGELSILTVGADADAYRADAVQHWPAADLLVMTPASAGRYGGLAPLASLHGLGVVLPEPAGAASVPPLTDAGSEGPRFYPMHTWDALHLRKGRTRLRVTALPGRPGTAHVAGFVLEMGSGRTSYRLYVSCEALDGEELRTLAERLPGADLALVPAREAPQVLPLRRGESARAPQPAALTAAGYGFTAVKR